MKFSIRDILLVTAIVAVSLGWWLERRRLLATNSRLSNETERLSEETKRLSDEVVVFREREEKRRDLLRYMRGWSDENGGEGGVTGAAAMMEPGGPIPGAP